MNRFEEYMKVYVEKQAMQNLLEDFDIQDVFSVPYLYSTPRKYKKLCRQNTFFHFNQKPISLTSNEHFLLHEICHFLVAGIEDAEKPNFNLTLGNLDARHGDIENKVRELEQNLNFCKVAQKVKGCNHWNCLDIRHNLMQAVGKQIKDKVRILTT